MGIKKTTLRIVSAVTITAALLTTSCLAVTVDDVREMLGRYRVGDPALTEEYEKVARIYILNELNNFGALLQPGEDPSKAEALAEREATNLVLLAQSDNLSTDLISSYTSNKPISEVMKLRTQLEGVLSQVKEIKNRGVTLNIEYIPNKWEQAYIQLRASINGTADNYDIGKVGSGLDSPIRGYFKVLEPYGSVKRENNPEQVDLNTGVLWVAPTDSEVQAQWNGTVTAIYNSSLHGPSIEIAHGSGMVTTYGGFKTIAVKEGQQVSQYELLGTASTDIWFTLSVDGLPANPLLLYGNRGLAAYKTWSNENPSRVVSSTELDNILTSAPTNEPEHGYYIPIDKPDPTINPGPDGFGENDVIVSTPDWYTRPKPQIQVDMGN